MDRDVFFHVTSPGYAEFPKDMFNNRGLKLKPKHGGSATVKIKRLNIAERLYRITGQGIYRDSVLVGHPVPLKQPVLNGEVMGQDTVIATPYRGKIYWFWGDTGRASYPLGNFGASGAISELPGQGGLDPLVGVNLTYFVDESGFSKPMCHLPDGTFHWIGALLTVPDQHGRERLLAQVANYQPRLDACESSDLMVFDDEKSVFEPLQHWAIDKGHDLPHPFRAKVDGTEYFYLFPDWRVKADLKTLHDLKNYEALTCVTGDGKIRGNDTELNRDAAGQPHYEWKAGADQLNPGNVRELISAGKLKPEESWMDLHDFDTGARIELGRGSVYWNPFRGRWIMLVSAKPGEIWFAEADTPSGPWAYARRVVTHGKYNFYNPTQHPFFDQEGGRLVYFEGTYSTTFSDARSPTPRYDYNQIMYRLTLDDPRLMLPVAVYRVRETNGAPRLLLRDQIERANAWERIEEVACFALPPIIHSNDYVSVYAVENGAMLSLTPPNPNARPLFVGLPLVESKLEMSLEGFWECRAAMPDGSILDFPLRFSLQGENLQVEDDGMDITGGGTFREEILTLTLRHEEETYIFDGRLERHSLAGTWRKKKAADKGKWSAKRSFMVAILIEYRRARDRGSYYSTAPQPPPGCEPNGQPLCRVWRVPGTVLTLDWKAKPVPITAH